MITCTIKKLISRTELSFEKQEKKNLIRNKRIFIIIAITLFLSAIPFVAMQFTKEVDWNLFDFVIMGALLFGTGLLINFILRKVKTVKSRIIICGVIIFLFFLIWAELAVGIIGTPFSGS